MISLQNLLVVSCARQWLKNVSLQASSDPSCHQNVELYLFSIFSNGYLHQIWPWPIFAALRYCFLYSETFPRIIPLGELDTIPHPPLSSLSYVQQNAALDVLCFPPHVRLPQVSVGRTTGSSPSRVHGSPRPPHLARDDLRDTWHESCCASLLAYFMVVLVSVMISGESWPSPPRSPPLVPSEVFEY